MKKGLHYKELNFIAVVFWGEKTGFHNYNMISLLSYAKRIALHKKYKILNNFLFFNNEILVLLSNMFIQIQERKEQYIYIFLGVVETNKEKKGRNFNKPNLT